MSESEQTLRVKFVNALTATIELYDSILDDQKKRIAALEKGIDSLREETRGLHHAIDELHKRISAHERVHDTQKHELQSEDGEEV